MKCFKHDTFQTIGYGVEQSYTYIDQTIRKYQFYLNLKFILIRG